VIIPDGDLWVTGDETLGEHLDRRGVSRRRFLEFCGAVAGVLTAGPVLAGRAEAAITAETIAQSLSGMTKPVLVWLQLQECTGCMESVLRSGDTTVEELILNLVSMDYNELLMAAAGEAADQALVAANEQPHILVVNG
jgi:hydrogenase small subunit